MSTDGIYYVVVRTYTYVHRLYTFLHLRSIRTQERRLLCRNIHTLNFRSEHQCVSDMPASDSQT